MPFRMRTFVCSSLQETSEQILLAKSIFMLEMWSTYAQNVRGF